MGRKGNYIGGSTIIGQGGSWPTLDPADPASETMPGKKEGKPSTAEETQKARPASSTLERGTYKGSDQRELCHE